MVQVDSNMNHFHKDERVSRLCCNFKLWIELRVDGQHEYGFSVWILCQWGHAPQQLLETQRHRLWKNKCHGHCHWTGAKPQDCASRSNEA